MKSKKSDINPLPEYFDRYISLVADVELAEAFDESIEQIENLDVELLKQIGSKTYAPERFAGQQNSQISAACFLPPGDKWTIKTIIQHIADFERILNYRTLLFARKDQTPQPDVDQDLLAANARAEARLLEDLIAELKSVRLATKSLFSGFDNETLMTTGINWKYEVSILAMGFNIIGHQIAHFKVIEENYYPLIDEGLRVCLNFRKSR